ncbi:MAG: hypothetical protein ACR2QH_05340 [Geminicoccaceae bacterium]
MDVIPMVVALLDVLDATTTAIALLALWDIGTRRQQDHHQPTPDKIEVDQFVDLARMHRAATRSM